MVIYYCAEQLIEIVKETIAMNIGNPVLNGMPDINLVTKYVDDVLFGLEGLQPGLEWDPASRKIKRD